MKIGIIGSGIVGRVLASAFLQEGHNVTLGTRNTAKVEVGKWKAENPSGNIGTFAAAASADIIVLATAGKITEEAIKLAGIDNFTGKTVIDATNPNASEPAVNGVIKFFTDANESLMERIQKIIPAAHLVKAFNSVGNGLMYKPQFAGVKPTMFICGDNEAAKKTVTGFLDSFGWETADMGKKEAARAIEPLCILWCIPGFLNNQWTHAFKLLKQ